MPIFLKGKLVYERPSLEDIKAYCAQQVDTLWDEVKRFDYPPQVLCGSVGQAVGYSAVPAAYIPALNGI